MTRRRMRAGVAGVALLVLLAWVFQSDELMLERPAQRVLHCQEKLARTLAAHDGLFLYLSLDEAAPRDALSGQLYGHHGTTRVRGRFGSARQFTGDESDGFASLTSWRTLGPSFTISLWIRPEPGGPDRQVVLGHSHDHDVGGLWLDRGRLRAILHAETNATEVSCPLPQVSGFVHVALVADGVRGLLSLHVDGGPPATAALPPLPRRPGSLELARNHHIAPSAYFRGAVDEVVILRRAASAREVQELAGARWARGVAWAGRARLKLALSEAVAATLRFLLKAADLFNPAVHISRIPRELPTVQIAASRSDLRQLAAAQARLEQHGLADAALGGRRRVGVTADGRTGAAWLAVRSLGGAPGEAPAREVWRLEFEDGRAAWLVPPESCDLVAPLAAAAVARHAGRRFPEIRCCALLMNGSFHGVYVWQEGLRLGVAPGDQHRHFRIEGLAGPAAASCFAEEFARHAPALLNDTRSPLSRRELTWRFRRLHAALAGGGAAPPPLEVADLLGDNRSMLYVTGPLTLPSRGPEDQVITWTSDPPDRVGPEGAVTPPAGPRPEAVTLHARLAGQPGPEFALRLMPTNPPLPALFLELDRPPSSFSRVDVIARLVSPQLPGSDRPRPASLKWRGKTALYQQKKSYSLRFEEPPEWFRGSASCHVYLMACYQDPSFIRDQLAHALFNSFGSDTQTRHAVRGMPVEVFINGVYDGIYSMTERVDRELLGWAPYQPGPAQPLLYRAYEPPGGFAEASGEGYVQIEPDPAVRAADLGPLRDLLRLTSSGTPDADFVRDIGQVMDLENVMDFFLLLNVMDNRDGEHWNYYLARGAGPGARWQIIPWDYDMSLRGTPMRRSNALIERLARVHPGFRPALRARWASLRAGPLSEVAMAQRLASMEAPLQLVAEWDARRWPLHRGSPAAWSELRAAWAARVALLDAELGYVPPPANARLISDQAAAGRDE